MPKKKYITIAEALSEMKVHAIPVSRPTIIKFIRRYNLGHQIGEKGGKWAVHAEKWRRFIDGKIEIKRTIYNSESDPANRKESLEDQFKKII